MQASSSSYQGYPYVNPHTFDAPTIDPATASRWSNLPRRQIKVSSGPYVVYSPENGASSNQGRSEPSSSTSRMALPVKPEPDVAPVVYIDLPETDGGSDVTQREVTPREERREQSVPTQREAPSSSSVRQQLPFKPEPDENPVVYIDLPDEGGSGVSQNREDTEVEPEFVQETIFYDPFENRRIDVGKTPSTIRSDRSWNSESDLDSIPDTPPRMPPSRPARPGILDLSSASGSSTTPPIPSISSSLTESYTRPIPENNLPDSLPITGFPEPPPAYTEFAISSPVVEQPRPQPATPPRTQVIVPGPVGLPNPDRKFLKCHHCGMHVHTLVIREVGVITHMSALICLLICMFPIILMIYCLDCLKNKSHFCPNCNKMIGYELPLNNNKVIHIT